MPDDSPSFHSGPAPRTERRWVAAVLFVLVVVVMPATTTVIAVERFPELSTLDEFAHIDYLRRVEDGQIPRMGDKVLSETARDVACRTIEGRGVSDCQKDVIDPGEVDAEGYSYEAQQPPVYYVITAVLRQPIRLVVHGYVNSARLTGAIWLAAGLAALWWFLRSRMQSSALVAAIVCAIVGLTPTVVSQASIVNNDAPAVLTGVLLLVGYEELRRNPTRRALGIAAVVGVILVLVKPLAILGIGAVTLALLLESRGRRASLGAMARLVVPAAAAAAAYQGWQLVRDVRAVVPYSEVVEVLLRPRTTLTEYPFDAIGIVGPRFVSAYWETGASMFTEPTVAGIAMCVGLLFVVTPSLSTAMGHGRRDLQPLHIALLAVLLIAPQVLIAQSYFMVHKGGGANARYALTLLPLTMTAVVPWLERRGLRWFALASVLVFLAFTVGGLLTYDLGAIS